MSKSMPPSEDSMPIRVAPLRLRQAREAHSVFTDALMNHFTYFDAGYKQKVLAENSLAKMMRGVFRPSRLLLVAQHGDRIIGYVIASVPRNGNGQVYWLFVNPDYRGQNIGLMLLSRALRIMAAKGAHTATLITHDHAKYYARQGFRLIKQVSEGSAMHYILSYDLRRPR